MKKAVAKKLWESSARVAESDMVPEYDFSKAKRNRYAGRFAKGVTVIVLDPDVAEVFPNSAAVNRALRTLVEAAPRPRRKATAKRRSA